MTTDPTDIVNVDFWADRIAALIKLAEHNGMTVGITGGELAVSRQVSDVFIARTEVQWRTDPAVEPATPPSADQPALRDRIVAAIKASPFEELRTVDHAANGPLQITVKVDDLADVLLRRMPPPADRAAEEAYRLALSTALRLGTGATWEAIRDRAEDLMVEVAELTEARRRQQPATNRAATTGGFVLWLDASDGSVPTHDGIQWPDGWATIRHRHYGHTTTHHTPEAAAHAAHGTQGRIVWPDADPSRMAVEAQQQIEPACPDPIECGHEAALGQAQQEIRDLRERHKASLRRADKVNNELMEEVQRYAIGAERPVLWSVYNRMHSRASHAEAALNRVRRIARRLTAHAAGFKDVLDDSDSGPWGRTVGADIAELIETLADQPQSTEVCGAEHPKSVSRNPILCQLPAGHTGGHRDAGPGAQPWREVRDDEQPSEADGDRIVAYRSALPGALSVYCTNHTDELGGGVVPLTSDDLPDGGVCAGCGVDVLIPQQPKEAAPAVSQCDGCGHLVHRARKCPAVRYGERCECDEPIAVSQPDTQEPECLCTDNCHAPCPYCPACNAVPQPGEEA